MTPQTPINQTPMQHYGSPFNSPNHERPFLQEIGEIRELVAQSVRNDDACISSLNKFGISTAEWNRQIFERQESDQRLQQEVISAIKELIKLRVALGEKTATCEAFRQAVAIEEDKTNTMAKQLEALRASNLSFVKVIEELSQALSNLSKLATLGSRGGPDI